MKNFNVWMFMLFVGTLIMTNMLIPSKLYSEFENRYLEQKPAFQWDNVVSGKFSEKYEKYVADQFAFRNQWMGLKAIFEKALLKKENNDIVFGKDGYLFNKYIKLPDRFFSNVEIIKGFLENNKDENVYVVIAPNSYTILEDLLPIGLYNIDQHKWLLWLQAELGLNDSRFINVYDTLKAHDDEYLYYRLDHHWTTLGAYYAYEAYSKQVGFTPIPFEEFTPVMIEDFYGTFYSAAKRKTGQADYIWYIPELDADMYIDGVLTSSIYDLSFAGGRDKYGLFLHNNPGRAKIKTELSAQSGSTSVERKVLVFKDSYANSMIPFLTNHYSEIEVIDLRYYNGSVASLIAEEWDDVLFLFNFISFSEDPYLVKLNY